MNIQVIMKWEGQDFTAPGASDHPDAVPFTVHEETVLNLELRDDVLVSGFAIKIDGTQLVLADWDASVEPGNEDAPVLIVPPGVSPDRLGDPLLLNHDEGSSYCTSLPVHVHRPPDTDPVTGGPLV